MQMVLGVRAVDSRCERLQRQRQRRVDACEQLADITRCLQQQASLCVGLQRHMLSRAITRRGLRALRSCHDNKGKLIRPPVRHRVRPHLLSTECNRRNLLLTIIVRFVGSTCSCAMMPKLNKRQFTVTIFSF